MTSDPDNAAAPGIRTIGRRTAALASTFALLLPLPALALPFDPVPSAFGRWLNSRNDWPNGVSLRFRDLAQCSDQTLRASPYRTPVYTCLKGQVTIRAQGKPERRCQLQRVSYFPTQKQVRYWSGACR